MKPETLNEIVKLIRFIKENKSKFDSETLASFMQPLNMVMFQEEKSPKIGKIDIFKFCANDELRPALDGVYYHNGYCYASDGHVLLKTSHGYNEEFNGKIMSKDGKVIEARYPDAESVIPTSKDNYTEYEVDFDLVESYMKAAKIWCKINNGDKDKCNINFHGTHFKLYYFALICSAMKEMGMTSLAIHSKKEEKAFQRDGNNVVLIMPLVEDNYKEMKDTFYCEIL